MGKRERGMKISIQGGVGVRRRLGVSLGRQVKEQDGRAYKASQMTKKVLQLSTSLP